MSFPDFFSINGIRFLTSLGPSLRVLRIKHSRRRKKSCFSLGHWQQYPVFQVEWSPPKSSAKRSPRSKQITPPPICPYLHLHFCTKKACFPSSRSQDDDICWYFSSCDSFSAQLTTKKNTTSIIKVIPSPFKTYSSYPSKPIYPNISVSYKLQQIPKQITTIHPFSIPTQRDLNFYPSSIWRDSLEDDATKWGPKNTWKHSEPWGCAAMFNGFFLALLRLYHFQSGSEVRKFKWKPNSSETNITFLTNHKSVPHLISCDSCTLTLLQLKKYLHFLKWFRISLTKKTPDIRDTSRKPSRAPFMKFTTNKVMIWKAWRDGFV